VVVRAAARLAQPPLGLVGRPGEALDELALGMSDDTPLAGMWRFSRMLKVADGPDEVHKMVIARRELNRAAKRAQAEQEQEPAEVRG
jgi:acyl-CoA dehydrogenase